MSSEQYVEELLNALRNGQQADEDGVIVKVSRQACEEAANLLIVLAEEVRADRAPLLARIADLEAQAAENEENDLARDEKLRVLSASHEIGCGCSYDNPDDVCCHHSPQLTKALARISELEGRLSIPAGGTTVLPDGSAFFTASLPLPKDHWLTADGENVPPMPMRMGQGHERSKMADKVRDAARYAIRASTMNGKESDFDPDAMAQNMVVGMLGYWTHDGTCGEIWADPDPLPPLYSAPGSDGEG